MSNKVSNKNDDNIKYWETIPIDTNEVKWCNFSELISEQKHNILNGNIKCNPFISKHDYQRKWSLVSNNENNNSLSSDNNVDKKQENIIINNNNSVKYLKYWMSDKNCAQCNECGAIFTTFKRKHHCRLCGRIFCNACCNQRIDGTRFKFEGMIRVCEGCIYSIKLSDEYLGLAISPLIKNTNNNNGTYAGKRDLSLLLDMKNDANDDDDINSDNKINKLYKKHILKVINVLLTFDGIDNNKNTWINKLFEFGINGNNDILSCNIINNDSDNNFNDIRHYIKIKTIPDGNINDSQYIKGVVFRKNVWHRKMSEYIKKPRILLLGCAIEYHRMNYKLISFEIILHQKVCV